MQNRTILHTAFLRVLLFSIISLLSAVSTKTYASSVSDATSNIVAVDYMGVQRAASKTECRMYVPGKSAVSAEKLKLKQQQLLGGFTADKYIPVILLVIVYYVMNRRKSGSRNAEF